MELLRKHAGKILALTGLFVAMFVTVAFAAPTSRVTITGGKEMQTGQEAGVTVTLTGDENFSETDLFITYDTGLLEFVSGDADEVENGRVRLRGTYPQGSRQQVWNVQFKALAPGSAQIDAEDVYVAVYNPEAVGSDSFDIEIQNTAFAIGEAAVTPAPAEGVPTEGQAAPADGTVPATDTQSLEEQILNDGTMSALVGNEKWMVQEIFPDEIIPANFVPSTQFYKGVEVKAAQAGNAPYYLLYVKSEDGTREKFCEYNASTKKFRDIVQLNLDPVRYLYVFDPESVPEGFQETVLTVGDTQFRSWQVNGAQAPYAADPAQYHLLYGYNEHGALGWFAFDTTENTLQRYAEFQSSPAASGGQEDYSSADEKLKREYEDLKSRFDFLIQCIKYVSVALVALLLLLLIVNLSEKGGKKSRKEKKQDKKERKKEKKAKKNRESEEEAPDMWEESPREMPADDTDEEDLAGESDENDSAYAQQEEEEDFYDFDDGGEEEAPEESEEEIFVDDYEEDDGAPKTEEEQDAIGVLKPISDDMEAAAEPEVIPEEEPQPKTKNFSMTDSIAELSRQIQNAMNEERRLPEGDDLDELTFINIDD